MINPIITEMIEQTNKQLTTTYKKIVPVLESLYAKYFVTNKEIRKTCSELVKDLKREIANEEHNRQDPAGGGLVIHYRRGNDN